MKTVLLVLLLIPGFAVAQSVRKTNRRLTSEYHSIKNEYDSVFAVYQNNVSLLAGIQSETTHLFTELFLDKVSQLSEVKRILWKSAADLRMVGLMNANFPGFPSQRLDSIGPDYVKIGAELKAIAPKGDTNTHIEKQDFTFISEGLSPKSQNDSLEKLLVEIRAGLKLVHVMNERIDTLTAAYTKINELGENYLKEIDQMIAYIEAYGAPVLAKHEEVKKAVRANPYAFDEEYQKVFAFFMNEKERPAACVIAMEFFEEGAQLSESAFKSYIRTEFPGGCDAMQKYLSVNLIMPASVKESGGVYKCYVRFIVSESGVISDIDLRKGVSDCPECDAEAIRVIKGMPNWIPGKNNGKPVRSFCYLPVEFKR